jgi:hypothetical protein
MHLMPSRVRLFTWDGGGERVNDARAKPRTTGAQIAPDAATQDQQIFEHTIAELFGETSLEQRLVKSLQPSLASFASITPLAYDRLLEATRTELNNAVNGGLPVSQRGFAAKAAAILEQDTTNRQLFQMYRHVLHQA